jgi:hypothetical protein
MGPQVIDGDLALDFKAGRFVVAFDSDTFP